MDHQAFAQLLGNYGEFVGAIAVVVTLAYLTIQIRQNNKSIRSQIYTSWVDTGALVHTLRADHPAVFRMAISPGTSPDELTEDQTQIAESICAHMFNLFEAQYLHFINGNIESSVFDAKRRNMHWRFAAPFVRRTWTKIGEHVYDKRFVEWMNSEIQRVDATTLS